jgi:hypothetical protein
LSHLFPKILRHVAGEDYLSQDQLAAWHLHLENMKSINQSPALRYARKISVRNEEYFRDLLKSAKGCS